MQGLNYHLKDDLGWCSVSLLLLVTKPGVTTQCSLHIVITKVGFIEVQRPFISTFTIWCIVFNLNVSICLMLSSWEQMNLSFSYLQFVWASVNVAFLFEDKYYGILKRLKTSWCLWFHGSYLRMDRLGGCSRYSWVTCKQWSNPSPVVSIYAGRAYTKVSPGCFRTYTWCLFKTFIGILLSFRSLPSVMQIVSLHLAVTKYYKYCRPEQVLCRLPSTSILWCTDQNKVYAHKTYISVNLWYSFLK